jgi:hypothetical protein
MFIDDDVDETWGIIEGCFTSKERIKLLTFLSFIEMMLKNDVSKVEG